LLVTLRYNVGNFMRTLAMLSSMSSSRWDRQFESGLLQGRVSCEPEAGPVMVSGRSGDLCDPSD
jgi:hypothetical protein